jgi:putative tricarboxylic transport membrane protein
MRHRDASIAIGFFALAVAFGIQASRFPFGSLRRVGPGFFPLVLALLLVGLSLALFLKTMRKEETTGIEWPGRRAGLTLAMVIAAIFAYSLLLKPLGFLLTNLLFSFVVFKISNPKGRFGPLAASLIATAFSVVFFKIWLGIPFPTGFIGY